MRNIYSKHSLTNRVILKVKDYLIQWVPVIIGKRPNLRPIPVPVNNKEDTRVLKTKRRASHALYRSNL